jgi:2-phospho-L-lactate guanylyltransferase (CobY/MobA/RfbA family)
VRYRVEQIASLALDIDTPEDLRAYMDLGREGPVRNYLLEIGIVERLAEARPKGSGRG